MSISRLALFLLGGLLLMSSGVFRGWLSEAEAEAPARAIDFATDIQPILEANCYGCHGPQRQRGGLRLDQKSNTFRGGDSGEAGVVPGDSAGSFLMHSLLGENDVNQMPLGGDPLSDEEIALIRRWIDSGADWPTNGEEQDDFLVRDHWSLKPVSDPALPATADDLWCSNPVDAFILARLDDAGLSPSPEASRRRLIRRVFFTLHGLAPTPEQMRRHLDDERDDWYARMVDELLASPRYGERWARHWLDIVRYSDSDGFETNLPRPHAYHYRDYVIRAFNEDKPYDRFIFEQLAGDAVGVDAATGFLVAGTKDIVGSPDPVLTAMQRSNELADMVNVTSTTFMGLTVACARCHHHKFDPILHGDYYAMEAVFAGVVHGERELRGQQSRALEIRQKINTLDAQIDRFMPVANPQIDAPAMRASVQATSNTDRFTPVLATSIRFVVEATNDGNHPCIDELEVFTPVGEGETPTNVALASSGATTTSSGDIVGNPIHQLAHLNDGRYGNSFSWISDERGRGWVQISFAQPQQIDRVVWGRDRTGGYTDRLAVDYRIEVEVEPGVWEQVAGSNDRVAIGQEAPVTNASPELKTLRARRAELLAQMTSTRGYVGTFRQPAPTHRLFRGDPSHPREVVAPDTITILDSLELDENEPEQNRRVALAESLNDPTNPLTARVMVNRIWQYHFGEGLVNTPSDFGVMGAKPTHPELLDYLATRFIDNDWSIKSIHRLILNSNTFRQDSVPDPAALRVDANSALLWRFPPRRHEAEVIRDSMLMATGKLDLTMYGPGFSFFEPNDNYVRVYNHKRTFGPEDWRRMIYAQNVRMERDLTFGGFDCPDGAQGAPRRPRSTTALQALNLLNSPFVMQQAELFAQRLTQEAGQDSAAQVRRAFELLFGRAPTPEELDGCVAFVSEHGLDALSRVLLNTNEFLFVE